MTDTPTMTGVWTAIVVNQWGQIHPAPAPDPEPYHRIMVVRALVGAQHVYDLPYDSVLYEAQGWKGSAVEWAEARAVAAALNAVQVSHPAAAVLRVRELLERADADTGVDRGGEWEDSTPIPGWTTAVRNALDGSCERGHR
jgi:hypothetical protein